MRQITAWTLTIALFLVMAVPAALAEALVQLKDGTVIRGAILEYVPDKLVTIKPADGPAVTYDWDKIEHVTQDEPVATDSSAMQPRALVTFDPLGFLFYGPMVGLEAGISRTSYLTVHVRWATLGLVYRATLLEEEGWFTDAVGADNLEVGIGYRALLGRPGPHHWYVGPRVELGMGSISGEMPDYGDWTGRRNYVSFLANFGYRWRFARSVVNVGVYAGAVRQLKNEWWFDDLPDYLFVMEKKTLPIGMLELSFGLPF